MSLADLTVDTTRETGTGPYRQEQASGEAQSLRPRTKLPGNCLGGVLDRCFYSNGRESAFGVPSRDK
jgi:hypothetical protein